MRQVGILAAAGLMALEDGPQRLNHDHENAKKLARGLAEIPGISIDVDGVVTNIVIFDIAGLGNAAENICERLAGVGILAIGFGKTIRMVTHLDVSAADIDQAVSEMRTLLA